MFPNSKLFLFFSLVLFFGLCEQAQQVFFLFSFLKCGRNFLIVGSGVFYTLIGFRFLGLRLIVDFVSFTVLYMFQIYRDLDVAFREKRRQCCLRSKQRKL